MTKIVPLVIMFVSFCLWLNTISYHTQGCIYNEAYETTVWTDKAQCSRLSVSGLTLWSNCERSKLYIVALDNQNSELIFDAKKQPNQCMNSKLAAKRIT